MPKLVYVCLGIFVFKRMLEDVCTNKTFLELNLAVVSVCQKLKSKWARV